MLTAEMIKKIAYEAGADKCGIAPISRMKGAPDDMNPMFLFPEAKSMIGFVFRIPRGVQRGIEEGPQFYQYPSIREYSISNAGTLPEYKGQMNKEAKTACRHQSRCDY